jgi:hypothetical protein
VRTPPVPFEDRPIWELVILLVAMASVAVLFWFLSWGTQRKKSSKWLWVFRSHTIGLAIFVIFLIMTNAITGQVRLSLKWTLISLGPYLVLAAQIGTFSPIRASRKRFIASHNLE